MVSARTVAHLALIGVRRWATSPRVWVLGVLAVLWIHHLASPWLTFSQSVGVRLSPWVFPFTLADWYMAMIAVLGVVLLFCDAPFVNNSTPYECIRSGRRHWVVGQVAYVALAAAILVTFLVAVSVACVAPNVAFMGGWGKVLKTLAETSAGKNGPPISYRLMLTYAPWQALALSSLILFLESVFVGLAMFTANLVSKKRAGGVLVGMLLAFLPAFADMVGLSRVYYFVPTAWANLGMLAGGGRYPSLSYIVGVLCGAILVLMASIVLLHRRMEIEVLLPV